MITADVELPILEALAQDPSISQRELAERAGLSLTRAHFVLRRLVEKGYVKVKNAAQSEHKLGYLYLLTPNGLEEKARLTYAFLHRAADQYRRMTERVGRALDDGIARAANTDRLASVAIVGDGPLAEVVRDLLAVRPDAQWVPVVAEAHVIVDVDGRAEDGSEPPGVVLVRLGG